MNVPSRFKRLADPKTRRAKNAAIIRFLDEIWDYGKAEYTFIYTHLAGSDRMVLHAMRGDQAAKIAPLLDERFPEEHDYYFCPNAFDSPRNAKDHALATRYAWADIDDAVPRGFKPKPNVLWETSKGQFQGLWIWRHRTPAHEAEQYSRILWQHYGGDRGAWSANKLLRVPGTVNHKPDRKGETVRLLRFDACPKRIPDLLRDVTGNRGGTLSHTIINPSLHDPQEVIRRYRPVMGAFAGTLMTATRRLRTDRSANVFAIVA